MRNLIAAVFLSACTGNCAELRAPTMELDANAVGVELAKKRQLTVCTARLEYLASDGYPTKTHDSYLVRFEGGQPIIVDRIAGFGVVLELRDVNSDGTNELLAFFSAGANHYGVKLYRIDKDQIVPLQDQPITSNMRSIKVVNGEVHVENQQRVAAREAIIETHRYRLDGERLVLSGSSKRMITQ